REAGKRVVAVETDLRKPTLANLCSVEKRPGVTDVMATSGELRDALQTVAVKTTTGSQVMEAASGDGASGNGAVDHGELAVITSGPQPPNPPAILASERMSEFLDQLQEEYDIVIIDSPPLLAVSDAVPLLPSADGLLL